MKFLLTGLYGVYFEKYISTYILGKLDADGNFSCFGSLSFDNFSFRLSSTSDDSESEVDTIFLIRFPTFSKTLIFPPALMEFESVELFDSVNR